MLLSAAELAQMRADVANMLPDSAVIYSPTESANDGAGGYTESYAPISGGTVACRVDPLPKKASVIVEPAKEGLSVDYILTVPYNAPIAANYRIVINSVTYEIVGLSSHHSNNVSRRAYINVVE